MAAAYADASPLILDFLLAKIEQIGDRELKPSEIQALAITFGIITDKATNLIAPQPGGGSNLNLAAVVRTTPSLALGRGG